MININGNQLTFEQIQKVSFRQEEISLSSLAVKRVTESRKKIDKIIKSDIPCYGINTGFGIFANKKISLSESLQLNRNLILSHAIGTGEQLPGEVVRVAMLIRVNTLAKGFSGIRLEIIQILIEMLNKGVTPIILSQGSLGSSGDLCMLAQMALVLTKDEKNLDSESGKAEYDGQLLTGKEAMERAGISRFILEEKEGLALINGATFSAALASINILNTLKAIELSKMSLCLTLEGMMGRSIPFDERIQKLRGYTGQIQIAKQIRGIIHGSTFIDHLKQIQDPYSIRCSPQVHGAIMDTVEFVRNQMVKEINAATDNPLIVGNDVLSGGNFHGEPIALGMDYLSIAMTELAAISERRIFLLTDEHLNNGLPPMLVDPNTKVGLNSGMMIPQYTAASLVLENRTLSTPDSVQSLPTSAGQEDHNANSMTAARHTYQIIKNTLFVLTLELYIAARAINLRMIEYPNLHLGDGTRLIFDQIRSIIPYQAEDTLWNAQIDKLYKSELVEKMS